MCNSKNHSPNCTCGFGGYGHLGRRGPSYGNESATYSYSPPSLQTKSPKELFLEQYPEFTKKGRVAACFVNPNATCPVCGDRVFYYQNENDSRVFFDGLGPPWPKHPCTDIRLFSAPVAGTKLGLTFGIRSQPVVAEILKWQKDQGTDLESDFTQKYGNKPWPLATIVKRMKGEKQVFIIAKLLRQGRATKVYLSSKTLPKCCKKGFLIAVNKGKISFIDTAMLAPVKATIKRYRGAAQFLDAMDDTDNDKR